MSVFIVSVGEYSDYSNHGVFSTKELADAFAAPHLKTGERAEVVEWPVDELQPQSTFEQWECCIGLAHGNISGEHSRFLLSDRTRRRGWAQYDQDYSRAKDRHGEYPFYRALAFSTVSAEHCQKIAIEARQRWLRVGNARKYHDYEFDDATGVVEPPPEPMVDRTFRPEHLAPLFGVS